MAAWQFQEQAAAGWDPIALWHQMGTVGKTVVIVLFIMSGWSIGVMIDRAMAFSAARKQSRAFIVAVRDHKIAEAARLAATPRDVDPLPRTGPTESAGRAVQNSDDFVEGSKRALERTEAIVHAELKRGLGGLATIGSTAPFVGLLGTVVGIVDAFKDVQVPSEKANGLAAIAGGISEALVTTAIGMFVAIPAVMLFNYLTDRVKAFDVEMDSSSTS